MYSPDDLLFLAPDQSAQALFAGGFARKILLLVQAEPQFPGNQDFLVKILAAAQVNPEKDTLWATVDIHTSISLTPVLKLKQPDQILVFGFTPQMLGLQVDIPLYRPTDFYGTTWLFAEALSVLEPDKARKGMLWKSLQQLFL
jgi:hypothetical protein